MLPEAGEHPDSRRDESPQGRNQANHRICSDDTLDEARLQPRLVDTSSGSAHQGRTSSSVVRAAESAGYSVAFAGRGAGS